MRTPRWRVALIVTVLLATPVLSYGQTVTAMWDANPPAQLVLTYDVCVGTTSLSCNFKNVSVPATDTSYGFLPNAGVLYRVAVRAVSAAGAGAYAPEVLVSTPKLPTLANRTSTANAAIAPVTITATDPDGSPLTYTHTGLPFGLTLNQSTGVITGTPTTTGTYNVTIFAADGLATAAAAFVWTVQTQSTDTTPPTLSITSHTNGQTVTTSSITLSGTATDSGTGNNGVQSVTVNGGAATGGTATGSNTASWSRSVTLASGANTITVVATDGVGNARTASITINRAASADTAAPTLSITSHTNGQQVEGSSLTLIGTATDNGTGGSGITSVTVNGSAATGGTATGNGTANWSRSVGLVNGANTITVVAADGAGNTRTVSITVFRGGTVTPVLSAVSVSPASGSGALQTFTAVFSDSIGAADLASALIKFDIASAGATNTCMVQYVRATNQLSLRDNAGNWLTGAVPGSAVTLQNSQCALSLAGSSVAVSGQNLTMNVAMIFSATYAGAKNVYLKGTNVAGATTYWQQRGAWTIPSTQGTLTAGTVTPNAGSSVSQLFSAQYADSLGTSDLASVELKFSTVSNGAIGVCMVEYVPAAGTLSLRDDAGVYQTPQTFASGVTQENSQCRVNFAGSSAILSGQTLTLNVAISFKPAFAGLKNIYSRARTISGGTTGLQQRGTWTVPSTTVSANSVTPNAGSGSSATFAAQFSDLYGVSDMAYVYIKFATELNGGANVCMVRYEPATGLMSLRDDSGVYFSGNTFAQGGTQQNSQCSIAFSTSTATVSGSTLTWSVNVTFKSAYAGAKNIYLNASTLNGSMTTWQLRGTWTVSGIPVSSGG